MIPSTINISYRWWKPELGGARVTEADEPQDDVEDGPGPAYGATRAPRSPRLTREDVFAAADAVLMAGGRVTIDRVRTKLGRGSPNTIQEHLETWWSRLGSRLKDIPGREFPELPDEVAEALQRLWTIALETAYAAIDGKAATREAELDERERALAAREAQWAEQAQAESSRTAVLEESLTLARDQLTAANHRAERWESLLQTREADLDRLRARDETLEAQVRDLRAKLDDAAEAHKDERLRLDERHAANEARWLLEVDRSRQAAKEQTKEHERQLKELRGQLSQLQAQRDESKRDLQEARADLRTAVSLRIQAEKRLAGVMLKAVKAARAAQAKTPSRTATGKRRR
jgi:DNA repair exonuclease SbcCD ATPase subunit